MNCNDKCKIAVCLAAYNGMSWLPEQLESILGQQQVNVTVYVSVDRSADGTEDWIDAVSQQDDRIVVLPHGEHSGGAARNFFRLICSIDFSGFDYVSLVDQDDIWSCDKLVRAVSSLRESGADGYSSNVVAFWSSGRRVLIGKSQPQKDRDFLFESAGPGCTYVMRVDFVRALQRVITQHWSELHAISSHDWFIYAYARADGFKWVIDPHPSMLYRQHAGNQMGANIGIRAFWVRVRKVWGGWWFGQAVLIARLVGMESDAYALALQRGCYLWLACRAGQCRRRWRDSIVFSCFCMLMWFKKSFSVLCK